ncbi:MAG TPA: DUF3618 domain-containing protein [Actinophytocola sp.]|uniref:DUF3618 domain-containing protein n=1 Tax=Actinophytocola sp. TaxID=1872138 RepID=UPI002DDD939B|nr:DUF3618 domain-containing protein [Actinophytocola sp.]HEV2784146.1 DUF3618 domain-containing protein [Actinophytocola sp.]
MTARQDRYAPPGAPPTTEDLEHEVELTRQELGDTVAELLYKMDIKSRTREATQRRVTALQARTRTVLRTVRTHPAIAATAALTAALATVLVLRLRH